MKNSSKLFIISMLCCLFLVSCEKGIDTNPQKETGIAFCAGNYTNNSGYQIPCYWSGTKRVDLTGEGLITGIVNAIYVKEGVVYCTGTYSTKDRSGIPCYWVGGVLHNLEATGYAIPYCITQKGGTVYSAGEYLDETSKVQSCYWVDGEMHMLPNQGFTSKIAAIGVSASGNVYCAGSNSSTYTGSPFYYKNNEYHNLSVKDILNPFSHEYEYHPGEVKSLDFIGEEVFFGGKGEGVYSSYERLQPQPGKWKEDDISFTALSTEFDGSCQSVCATAGTVYYGGNLDPDGPNNANKMLTACYWSEGSDVTYLPDGQLVQAIGIYNSTLYCIVTGATGKTHPIYWDGSNWYDLVGESEIANAQVRCYAIARK